METADCSYDLQSRCFLIPRLSFMPGILLLMCIYATIVSSQYFSYKKLQGRFAQVVYGSPRIGLNICIIKRKYKLIIEISVQNKLLCIVQYQGNFALMENNVLY